MFSRQIAFKQLELLELIPKKTGARGAFEKFPDLLENVFREGWTNNADAMSYLYTGTPALKTDFTRTGKRTHKGAINDGINSVTRYFINNFTDGYYHDCMDVCTQKLIPGKDAFRQRSGFFSQIKLLVMLIFMMTYGTHVVYQFIISSLDQSQLTWKHSFLNFLVVVGTFTAGLYGILLNGRKFVDDSTRYV